MLRTLNDLERYDVCATDGVIGKTQNFLLDDERWTVRYLVVDGGSLLDERRVLVSPGSFRTVDWATRRFHVALTKATIARSPSVGTHEPVSRQHEQEFCRYYGYPYYWDRGPAGTAGLPNLVATGRQSGPDREGVEMHGKTRGDVNLRSAREICGYHVQCSDGEIGHLEDFIVDDETWAIRYFVVDSGDWWFGKRALVSPEWTSNVDWNTKTIKVAMTREGIRASQPSQTSGPP